VKCKSSTKVGNKVWKVLVPKPIVLRYKDLGWKVATFLPFPCIARNSSLFLFLLCLLEFLLEGNDAFKLAILEDYPLPCDF